MDEKLDKAIDLLISQFKPGTSPKVDDSMKLSQAILNLAHVKQLLMVLALEGKPKKPTS